MPISSTVKALIKEDKQTFTHLDLTNHGINDQDITVLHELLSSNHYIDSITLEHNNIESPALMEIGLLLNRIKKLNLSQNKIDDSGVRLLFENTHSQLEWLDLSSNALTDVSGLFLLDQLTQGRLKYVNINQNQRISREVLQKITSKVQGTTTLSEEKTSLYDFTRSDTALINKRMTELDQVEVTETSRSLKAAKHN